MNNLTVAVVQTSIHWEEIKLNMDHLERLLRSMKEKADIIILPEMFTTGFSMEPEKLAEDMDGAAVTWLKTEAAKLDSVIIGSLIIKEKENHYNRLFWMPPTGNFTIYNKRHLFRMGDEQHHYSQGKSRLIEKYEGWRIMPLICYDLRFPVWSRNRNEYDLLIYIANWPEARREVWKTLLKARALENQTIQPNEEKVEILTLSLKELNEFREKFPVYLDADEFEIDV